MTLAVRALALALLASLLALSPAPQAPTPQDPAAQNPTTRSAPRAAVTTFESLDVFVDTTTTPLAAWQAEITLDGAKLVGVEGGAHSAFADAPRYDAAALQGGRVLVAALATGDDLPSGRIRVARLHVALTRSPDAAFTPLVQHAVVADPAGRRIRAALAIRPTPKTR